MGGEHSHLIDFPEALEALFTRLGELRIVLGAAAAPGLGEVERLLREALAARDRGAVPVAMTRVADAMDRLAIVAAPGDPAEGAMMRAMANTFRQAVARGSISEAHAVADVMRDRSGSTVTPKKPR